MCVEYHATVLHQVLLYWASEEVPYLLSCEGRTTACPLLSWVVLKRMFLLYAATLPLNSFLLFGLQFTFTIHKNTTSASVYYCEWKEKCITVNGKKEKLKG